MKITTGPVHTPVKLTHQRASPDLVGVCYLRLSVVACGYYCLGCETNGASRCDPSMCMDSESGLSVGVVYSNSTQTCVREYRQPAFPTFISNFV